MTVDRQALPNTHNYLALQVGVNSHFSCGSDDCGHIRLPAAAKREVDNQDPRQLTDNNRQEEQRRTDHGSHKDLQASQRRMPEIKCRRTDSSPALKEGFPSRAQRALPHSRYADQMRGCHHAVFGRPGADDGLEAA